MNNPNSPGIVIANIPGLDANCGKVPALVNDAVDLIEGLREGQITEAVACIPDELHWDDSFDRRLAIADWLINRRELLREVMQS